MTLDLKFVVVLLMPFTVACGDASHNAAGDHPIPPTSQSLHRCVDVAIDEAIPRSAGKVELTSSSVDTSIGLSCGYQGSDRLSISLYQYGDDAEFRRQALTEYEVSPTFVQLDGVGDGAYRYPAHVYGDGTVTQGTTEIDFDAGTSRWKVIVSGKPSDLDRVDDVGMRVARQAAKISASLGPLNRMTVVGDPAMAKSFNIEPHALTDVLKSSTPPTPAPGLSQTFQPASLERSLTWDATVTQRMVTISSITGLTTPRAYVDRLEQSSQEAGYPYPFKYSPAKGLGDGALQSRMNFSGNYTSYVFLLNRGGGLCRVSVSSSGSQAVTEDEALSFVKEFHSAL